MSVSEKKRKLILDNAKKVFVEKGFSAVTMKDIIEECGISRGGIYIYFTSVEEIYRSMIEEHNIEKLKEEKKALDTQEGFITTLNKYFSRQKNRLLHINDSLLFSMYEFRFSQKTDLDIEFFHNQYLYVKQTVLSILNLGVEEDYFSPVDIDGLAAHIVFLIEGLTMLGTAAGITETEIDLQIKLIKRAILNYKKIG